MFRSLQALYLKYKRRTAKDFQLSVLSTLGLVITCAITPFAIYRYSIGDFKIFFAETTIIIVSSILVLIAWISHNATLPSKIMAIMLTFSIVLTAKMVGSIGFYWFFCSIVLNFALLKPREALIIITAGISLVFYLQGIFSSFTEKMIFTASVSATTLFGFLVAKRNMLQQQQLIQIARTDSLTNTGNRRSADEEFDISISDFKRTNMFYWLIVFDIDHFKDVNDSFGHEIGDQTLTNLVKIIKQHIRATDRLFRIGGEEFALLIKDQNVQNVEALAEKLRELVEKTDIIPARKITISLGVTCLEDGDSVQSWTKRADDMLYLAKKQGRNQVVTENQKQPIR